MRLLFLTSAHNSLSQRAMVELTALGHRVDVALATSDRAMLDAVARHRPELIVAPMLKRAIPEEIWRRQVCLIVHPGPRGDRGPSSLDWAIAEGRERWGVTVLQADAVYDAGDIWASREFALRPASKSSLYREEVVEAAIAAIREAVEAFTRGDFCPTPLDYDRPEVWGRARRAMKQADRRIDWSAPTEEVLRTLRAADSNPGILDRIGDEEFFLFGHQEEGRLRGTPGALLAWREGGVCRATGDGAVWLGGLKRRHPGQLPAIKLPAPLALGPQALAAVPYSSAPAASERHPTHREIWYEEAGAVGFLHFAFLNGAMSTDQCRRLHAALREARRRPTRVLVLMGGADYWSNGIHLNVIEAASSPADESWRNINAMNDLVHELVATQDKLVIAAMQGSAGAGGVILALAADYVWARSRVVLNPHYRGMGGLYGSEYWTYLLPGRVGRDAALEMTEGLQPLGARAAEQIGLIDKAFDAGRDAFPQEVAARAADLAGARNFDALVARKQQRRARDEARKPLATYRREELAEMHRNFYGPDPAYHEARHRFVHKLPAPEPIAADFAAELELAIAD